MADTWLPILLTDPPQQGYDLAAKLARVVVKMTQADPAMHEDLRSVCKRDAAALIPVSSVVATHFQNGRRGQ